MESAVHGRRSIARITHARSSVRAGGNDDKGPGFVVRGRLLAGQGKTPEALEALARATADAESINAESIRDLCEAFVMPIHLVTGLTTVKTHVNGIFRKLGASNRFEAVTRARAVGLLERVGHTAEEPNPE